MVPVAVPLKWLIPFLQLSNFQTRLRGGFGNMRLGKNPLLFRHQSGWFNTAFSIPGIKYIYSCQNAVLLTRLYKQPFEVNKNFISTFYTRHLKSKGGGTCLKSSCKLTAGVWEVLILLSLKSYFRAHSDFSGDGQGEDDKWMIIKGTFGRFTNVQELYMWIAMNYSEMLGYDGKCNILCLGMNSAFWK